MNEFSDGTPGSYLRQQATDKLITDNQTADDAEDFSGDYNDLDNKPEIPDAQIQSDWTQSDNTQKDFIKNKPTIPTVEGGTGDVVIAGTGTLSFANGLFTGFVAAG